jgi:hypothetical protein
VLIHLFFQQPISMEDIRFVIQYVLGLASDSSFQNLLIILAIPSVLSFFSSFFRKPATASKPTTNTSKWDHIGSFVLIAAISLHIAQSHLYKAYPNVFTELELDYNAPNFMLRNRLRDVYGIDWNEGKSTEDDPEVERVKFLGERLRSTENRWRYVTFGEEAYMQCTYCTDGYDYALWLSPVVGGWYLMSMGVVGLVTALSPKRAFWRLYATTIVLVYAAMEVAVCLSAGASGSDQGDSAKQPFSLLYLYNTVTTARHLMLAFVFGLMLLLTRSKEQATDVDIATRVLHNMQEGWNRQAAWKLMRQAVARDDELRTRAMDTMREKELVRREVVNDSVYARVREDATKRLGDDVTRESANVARGIMNAVRLTTQETDLEHE